LSDRHPINRLCALLPTHITQYVTKELQRRAITQVPPHLIVSYPGLETVRTMLARTMRSPIGADIAWDISSRNFDRTVARQHIAGCDAVYAFEYTARDTFKRAKEMDIARILALPSLDSKTSEELKGHEESQFPELRNKHHAYFTRQFPDRYERRIAEI